MGDVKIAIIARSDDASPKVLAQGLQHMLYKLGASAQIFWGADALLRRLLPLWKRPRHWYLYPHRRLQQKLIHWEADRKLLSELREYSAIVFCDCIPNAMWRNYYDIESLRRCLPGIPILLYEVYYLGNAPTMQRRLTEAGDFGTERYDWHLAVSEVTEVRGKPQPPWNAIGLDLEHTGLHAIPRQSFVVVVDFAQSGYERYREEQLTVLRDLPISTIVLEGRYPVAEIRKIYQEASVLLIQFPESFGVSIAECLCTGACIFTPRSGWPMAFRLDKEPQVGGPGELPEIFRVYQDAEDLRQQLLDMQQEYDPDRDPYQVAGVFRETYPTFWSGNSNSLENVVARIGAGKLLLHASLPKGVLQL